MKPLIALMLLFSGSAFAQSLPNPSSAFVDYCTAGVGGVTANQIVRTVSDGTTIAPGSEQCIVVPTLHTNTGGNGHGVAYNTSAQGGLVLIVQLGIMAAWSSGNVTSGDIMGISTATDGMLQDLGVGQNSAISQALGTRGRAQSSCIVVSPATSCQFTLALYPNQTMGGLLGSAAYSAGSAFDASGAAATVQGLALLKANNLSDLASAATSRSNLGISTVGNTGAYADLTGKPTIPAAQVNSDWSAVSGLPQILNKPLLTQASATRTLNTCFQVSTTHAADVHYSVEIATTVSLTGGATGTVFLETFTDSACTLGVQELGRLTNSQTGALVVGLTLNQTFGAQINGWVTPAAWVKLVTSNVTGTPTFTYRSGQEVLF